MFKIVLSRPNAVSAVPVYPMLGCRCNPNTLHAVSAKFVRESGGHESLPDRRQKRDERRWKNAAEPRLCDFAELLEG